MQGKVVPRWGHKCHVYGQARFHLAQRVFRGGGDAKYVDFKASAEHEGFVRVCSEFDLAFNAGKS